MFNCEHCNRKFTRKVNMQYHTEKRVCRKYECLSCNKIFKSHDGLEYHLNNKVCEKKVCEKKVDNKKITLKKILSKVNQIDFIFPKAFGTEEISNILKKLPNLLHDALTKHSGHSIEYITEQIHCNKMVFPEYVNVYLNGYKSPFALVSDGQQFKHKPQKRIIDQIIEKSISMLQNYMDANSEKYDHKIIKKYDKYINLIESDENDKKTERRKDLEIEIAGLLLDMRSVIELDPNMKIMLDKLGAD